MTRKEFRRMKKQHCPHHFCLLCKYEEECHRELDYREGVIVDIITVVIILCICAFCFWCVCTGFNILG